MKKNPVLSIFSLILLIVLAGVSSCCSSCDDYSQKHKYSIGDVVQNVLDPNLKYIILDTTRSGCDLEYEVEDSAGYREYILEMQLKK